MRGKSRILVIGHMAMAAALAGRHATGIVVDEYSDDLPIRIVGRHDMLEVPKCHAPAWPEKQYGKKYRRLLRSGKR